MQAFSHVLTVVPRCVARTRRHRLNLGQDKGPNSLTRQNLIALLDGKPAVSAQGILDPKTVLGSFVNCWVIAQAKNGTYVRIDPGVLRPVCLQ
ncbi:MAG: hypothetical protein JOZ87_07435 [Chloroflexi bacterium]|nr:hypothetical protein [Chloroflexota bacterium]